MAHSPASLWGRAHVLPSGHSLGSSVLGKSHGGHFPSRPGRHGPRTSAEGAHLRPNPRKYKQVSPPLRPTIHPSISSLPPRSQKSPVNSKHLDGQGPTRGPPFPESAQMKFYSLHEKIAAGGGEITQNKAKQTEGEDQGRVISAIGRRALCS